MGRSVQSRYIVFEPLEYPERRSARGERGDSLYNRRRVNYTVGWIDIVMGQDGSLGKETDKTNSGENLKGKGRESRLIEKENPVPDPRIRTSGN